jgi:phage-related protein
MNLLTLGRGRWHVLAVCDDRGQCEVLDFLEALCSDGERQRKHALAMLALLEQSIPEDGPPRAGERSGSLGDDIFEFRSVAGEFRVLWFYDKGKVIVCTHAFKKSEQRTDPAEIKRAKRIKRDYELARDRDQLAVEDLS